MSDTTSTKIPSAFVWRRLQSFMGLWLVLFLIEHLLTNSQAALFFGDDGSGFIHAVNSLHNLPYLQAIEITLLGVPFLIHIIWGIQYIFTSEPNSYKNTGKDPYLPQYPRNHAYTWQRITSWILLVGLIGHVVQMRFIDYPTSSKVGAETHYVTRVGADSGLPTLAERLDVKLYDKESIEKAKNEVASAPSGTDPKLEAQHQRQHKEWVEALEYKSLNDNQLMAVTPNFGTAVLLNVRETFKSPLMIALYTVFVLTAVFHATNGVWTFCVTWGITLTERSQVLMRRFTTFLMVLLSILGLAAIWGTYYINLNQ